MHYWGDEGVDWQGISDAATWIGQRLKRWGRVPVTQTKEKYGTARVYCYFGWSCPYSFFYPGWWYYKWPKWTMSINYSQPVSFIFNLINYCVVPYHKWLYRKIYKKALDKWPQLVLEILHGADYGKLLIGLNKQYDDDRKKQYEDM